MAAVIKVVGRTEEREIYRAAFDQVLDPADWRNPVDCYVPHELANLYLQAIEFMTGVRPTAERVHHEGRDCFHLTCIGYRAGPCGG